MFRTLNDFAADFASERDGTLKILDALTDEALQQSVAQDHRTIGRMCWHIVTSYPEMMGRAGLTISTIDEHAPMPTTAREIRNSYAATSQMLLDEVIKNWTDAVLLEERDMYGVSWQNGFTLEVLIRHEVHHRAQMTVLMRQAGLKVPGVYGPALEEWSTFGMPAPLV